MIKKSKKGQEESMGFVIIVLILVIVGVVFLGFSLRKTGSSVQNQQELADLTWSVLSYTTNCSILGERQSIWDLAKKCSRSGGTCEDEVSTCTNLNLTIQDIFKTLKGSGVDIQNKSIHAYDFVIDMREKKAVARQGNLSGNYVSYVTFIPTDINVSARFYYT
jgi:hypothetical protein